MPETTCIRNIDWAIVWDKETKRHVYRRNIDIAFTGGDITFVGRNYGGSIDQLIDGRRLFVLPGMVSIHTHMSKDTQSKGLFEESGSLLSYDPVAGVGHDFRRKLFIDPNFNTAFLEYGAAEMLQSGSTTVVDMVSPYPAWLTDLVRSGIRAYAAPMYSSAEYDTSNGHLMTYNWDEAKAQKKFEEALRVVKAAEQHECNRLKGMLVPAQADSCTEALFRDSVAAARELGIPIQTHASQTMFEFHEMVSRHGKTPIEFLADIGFLGPTSIIGHAVFIDQHPWINFSRHRDLDLLVESGATVAHCPVTQTRRGKTLQSFGRYRKDNRPDERHA